MYNKYYCMRYICFSRTYRAINCNILNFDNCFLSVLIDVDLVYSGQSCFHHANILKVITLINCTDTIQYLID